MLRGMSGNDEQATAMAAQLKRLSPGQVRMLTKAATVAQASVRGVRRVREILASHAVLIAAALVLLVALVLRWYGIM
jgi:hypothetical protein